MSSGEEEMHRDCSRQLEKLMKLLMKFHSYDWEGDDRLIKEEIDQAMSALARFDLLVIGLSSYFMLKLLKVPFEIYTLEETFEMLIELGRKSWLIELQKNSAKYRDDLLIFFDTRCGQPSYFYSTNYSDPVPAQKARFYDGDQDILFGSAKKKFGDKFTRFFGRCLLIAKWNAKKRRWVLDKVYCFTGKGLIILSA